jgi:signal transduction histidine kinase
MSKSPGFRGILTTTILRWRWRFVALLIFTIFAYQIYQQQIYGGIFSDLRAFPGIIFNSLVIPLLIGFILSLEQDRIKLRNMVGYQEKQQVAIQQLASARDLEGILAILYEISRTELPFSGASLSLYHPHTGQYRPSAVEIRDWSTLPEVAPSLSKMNCSLNQKNKEAMKSLLVPCNCLATSSSSQPAAGYCIPLFAGDREAAVLHLFLPKGEDLDPGQAGFLSGLAPEAALAIERATLKDAVENQSNSVNESQDRLARYLHDTLGHNIAYIRLKLDQLMGAIAVEDSPEMRHEIGRLLDVANEAYEQVRGTLVELRRESTSDLPLALKDTAEIIGRRANFKVDMATKGEPRILQPEIQRQILYIAREALRNIEKHAQAENVWVDLTWNEGELSLTITDDGKGFDPTLPTTGKGHFGLKLIHECADEINGRLMVTSSGKTGTLMTLEVPYQIPA